MKALVIGSGVATGLPTWNDGSEAAARARARDLLVPRRRGATLAVSADGLRYSLIEAPFSLASTLAEEPRYAPAPGGHSVPIDTLVLTSADLDASGGALALRSGLSMRVASPADLKGALVDHDASFASMEALWLGMPWDRALSLDREEHLEARLFPLPGPIPDHLRGRSKTAGRARCGVRITDRRSGLRLVWAPRIGRYDSATLAELRAADIRFVDGTCYSDEEARRLRPGTRFAHELGHVPIDGREGSLAWLSGMGGRSIYVHLAASNPICDAGSKESARVLEAGVEIAVDGLEVAP